MRHKFDAEKAVKSFYAGKRRKINTRDREVKESPTVDRLILSKEIVESLYKRKVSKS